MEIYVEFYFISIFFLSGFQSLFYQCSDFTHIALQNTEIDDVTN